MAKSSAKRGSAADRAAIEAAAKRKKEYRRNDAGNAKRLKKKHGKDMRWVTEFQRWFVWGGAKWLRDGNGAATRNALDMIEDMLAEADKNPTYLAADGKTEKPNPLYAWADNSGNKSRLAAMLAVLADLEGMTASAFEFDRKPELVVFEDKTLVFGRDGVKVRDHRRSDLCSRSIPHPYNEGAECPGFMDMLDAVMPDKAEQRTFRKALAVSMRGGNVAEIWPICWGATWTGKSTVLNIIERCLGGDYADTYGLSLFREKWSEAPRPDIVDVISKRFIWTSEASDQWELHNDMAKRATGGDPLKARMPHKGEFISKKPDFVPWLATNNPPTIVGADRALFRRLLVFKFRHRQQPDDSLESEIVAEEAEGILAWIVGGWDLYREEGLHELPTSLEEARLEFWESLHHFDRFLSDVCDRDENAWTPFTDIYTAYLRWCEKAAIPEKDRLTDNKVGRYLTERGFERGNGRKPGARLGKRDPKVAGRKGLSIKPTDDAIKWSPEAGY